MINLDIGNTYVRSNLTCPIVARGKPRSDWYAGAPGDAAQLLEQIHNGMVGSGYRVAHSDVPGKGMFMEGCAVVASGVYGYYVKPNGPFSLDQVVVFYGNQILFGKSAALRIGRGTFWGLPRLGVTVGNLTFRRIDEVDADNANALLRESGLEKIVVK